LLVAIVSMITIPHFKKYRKNNQATIYLLVHRNLSHPLHNTVITTEFRSL
jgi:hypothetical protein